MERVNGRLKDDFGGRQVRVRGHAKVLCHLMFGILALTVAQWYGFWPETDLSYPAMLQALHAPAEDARERSGHSQTKRLHRRRIVTEVKHHRRLWRIEPKTANYQS